MLLIYSTIFAPRVFSVSISPPVTVIPLLSGMIRRLVSVTSYCEIVDDMQVEWLLAVGLSLNEVNELCEKHLCVCAFVHLCICAFVRLCICAFVHLCICAFVHLCICASVHLCICALQTIQNLLNVPPGGGRLTKLVIKPCQKFAKRGSARCSGTKSDMRQEGARSYLRTQV